MAHLEDPEIYAEVVAAHPGRILAVYIRNVLAHPERSSQIRRLAEQVTAANSSLVLADDTLAAARHAAAYSWIKKEALAEVGEEKRAADRLAAPHPGCRLGLCEARSGVS